MFGAVMDNLLIGVVGSLIATIIAFLVTQLREHIKHQKRIKSANLFVIDRLRAYIVNADIPSDEILNALRKSAARKFDLKEYELWPVSTYVEETVAEIIGNVYLKMEEQTSYLEKANTYLVDHEIVPEKISYRMDNVHMKWRVIFLFILFITFLAFYVLASFFSFLIFRLIEKIYLYQHYEHYFVDVSPYLLFSRITAITIVSILFLIIGILFFPKIKRKIISILRQR